MQMLIARVIANLSLFDPPLPSAPTCTHLQTCWCLHHGNSFPSRLSLTAVDRRKNTGRKIWQHPVRVLQKKGVAIPAQRHRGLCFDRRQCKYELGAHPCPQPAPGCARGARGAAPRLSDGVRVTPCGHLSLGSSRT